MTEDASLRQQIGEILGTVRALDTRIADRRREARDAEERIWAELRTLKHEARNADQVISSRLELADIRMRQMETAQADFERTLAEVKEDVEKMRVPLDELMEMRRRIASLGALGMSIIIALWALAEPVWRLVVQGLSHVWDRASGP